MRRVSQVPVRYLGWHTQTLNVFVSSHHGSPEKEKPIHYWREVHYEPIEGRLIMFPGWLVHEVAPNMSNLKGEKGWRCSVSFNFKQRWIPGQYVPRDTGHESKGDVSIRNIK